MTATQTRVSLKGNGNSGGGVTYIRPSELTVPGIVAKGKFIRMEPNNLDKSKNNYVLDDGGSTIIVNSSATLRQQLEQPGVLGLMVEIEYKGKGKTKAGKDFHNFEVYAWKDAAKVG